MTTIHTVGHSNRERDEFISLLATVATATLVDVRAWPVSRRQPQFSREPLVSALATAGIGYLWLGNALGGQRDPNQKSVNTALRSPALRAYADHMAEASFASGIDTLLSLAREQRVCLMCAEREPPSCHRTLIADYLVVHGCRVEHLITLGETRMHVLHASARLDGGRLVYAAPNAAQHELW